MTIMEKQRDFFWKGPGDFFWKGPPLALKGSGRVKCA